MAWAIFVLVVVLIVIALMHCNLTALSEPGRFETRTANMAKRCFHPRASRKGIPPRPVDTKTSVETGAMHYGLDCSVCHAALCDSAAGEAAFSIASGKGYYRLQSRQDVVVFAVDL